MMWNRHHDFTFLPRLPIKPPRPMPLRVIISTLLQVLLCIQLSMSLMAEEAPAPANGGVPQIAVPIDPSHRNPYTKIRNRILPDTDFQIAILPTSGFAGVYGAVVIVRDGAGYRCEDRQLDTNPARAPDGRLNPTKLMQLKVITRTRSIAPEWVTMLIGELTPQVRAATYRPINPASLPCDGGQNEVYSEGRAALIYPANQERVNDPDLISTSLRQFVVSDNPTDLGFWYRLRDFLQAKKAGLNPSPIVPRKPAPTVPSPRETEIPSPPL